MYKNKIHLRVVKDMNGWLMFSKGTYRVQLCWDNRKEWFWLSQYAKKLWKDNFFKDFTEILQAMEADSKSAFTLYELYPNWATKWNTSDTSSQKTNQS